MTQIAPLTIDTADAATAATLKAVKAKLGMVPNLFATLAHAPAALNGYLGLSETLGTGRLSATQREIVALAAGQANRCQYCLTSVIWQAWPVFRLLRPQSQKNSSGRFCS